MTSPFHPSRRFAIAAGIASLAVGALPRGASAVPKSPGQTKVLYFGGDYIHNGVGQERYLRQTFSKSGWRLMFVQASRFITPRELADTDLFMMTRTGASDAQGYNPDGIVETRPEPDPLLPSESMNALIDNITNRGMGFMALHCTAGNPELPRLMELLGVKPLRSGAKLQPVRFHDFNPDHPVSRGFADFEIELDENLHKEIVAPDVVPLFKTTGLQDGSVNIGGWSLERGKGRIVVLLAGHTNYAWSDPNYRQLHWRAAHWALRRDIPPFEMEK
jgi:type 1 glutamine amidotransferase